MKELREKPLFSWMRGRSSGPQLVSTKEVKAFIFSFPQKGRHEKGDCMNRKFGMAFCLLSVVTTLGLSLAVVQKAIADSCSGCSDSFNTVAWDSTPTAINAAGDGTFSFNQIVRWWYQEPRNQ